MRPSVGISFDKEKDVIILCACMPFMRYVLVNHYPFWGKVGEKHSITPLGQDVLKHTLCEAKCVTDHSLCGVKWHKTYTL